MGERKYMSFNQSKGRPLTGGNNTKPLNVQVRTGESSIMLLKRIRSILKALDLCKTTITTNDSKEFTGSKRSGFVKERTAVNLVARKPKAALHRIGRLFQKEILILRIDVTCQTFEDEIISDNAWE